MIYTIRRYYLTDIPAMVDMVQQFLLHQIAGQSNYFVGVDFVPTKVYNLLKMNISNPEFFCNIVEDEQGKLVGGMAGYLAEFIFSDKTVAKDHILFMSPEVVSSRIVIRLVTTFVTWAKNMNATEVQLCNSTGFKQQQFAALAKLMKMQQFEIGYSRRF